MDSQSHQRRRQTSVEQLAQLVEYLEQHKDLALGRVRSKEARALSARLWRECSLILNVEGPARTGKEWAKVWNDLKCRVRAKLVSINASLQATGGGPSTATSLTPLEDRIANILGRDVGPLPNVRQDPFALVNESMNEDNPVESIEEYLVTEAIEPLDRVIQLESTLQESPIVGNVAQDVVVSEPAQENVERLSPMPVPIIEQVPPTPGPSGDRSRLRGRRQQRTTAAARHEHAPPPPAQSNRTALDESRVIILEIEKMRAEAALINARASNTIAESFKLLAESVDRFTRQYLRQQEDED